MALFGENYGTIRVEKWLEKKEVLNRIRKYGILPVDELVYITVIHLLGLRDDKGKLFGAKLVLHPFGNSLTGPVLYSYTTSHMTGQLLIDIRVEHLIGYGIVMIVFLHIRIQELAIVFCP